MKQETNTTNGNGTTIVISEDTVLSPINARLEDLTIVISNGATLTCAQTMSFNSGTHIDVQNGKLLIAANVSLKENSQIDITKGCVEIQAGKRLTIGRYSSVEIHALGLIDGAGVLRGNQAVVTAPVRMVFGSDLTVEGNWNNARVYPQWFGAVGYATINDTENEAAVDSAVAINKAIQMKCIGEVFVPRGFYRISSVVDMKMGIELVGETGFDRQADTDGSGYDYGSVLVARFNNDVLEENLLNSECLGNFMLRINANDAKTDSEWQVKYPQLGTSVRNIRFKNRTKPLEKKFLNCAIAFDSVTFDAVTFVDFCQAVRYATLYIDSKVIKNCTYYCGDDYKSKGEYNNGDVLASFDMGWLGDGVLFEHNAVHEDNGAVGFRMLNCGSANINANILNTNIVIISSKGIDFSANHIEGEHSIEIISSQVSLRNNYMWLHKTPSVVIKDGEYNSKSVVSMDGNVFRFYDTVFYEKPQNPQAAEETEDTSKYIIPQEVVIGDQSVLSINNCFRYWGNDDFGKIYASGIYLSKITKDEYTPIEDFNRFSYALSKNSIVGPGQRITSNFSVKDIDKLRLNPVCMRNERVRWVLDKVQDNGGEIKTYAYKMQVLFDAARGIGTGIVDIPVWDNADVLDMGKNENGVLINTNCLTECCIVRLYRTISGETRYVDVPVCGTNSLYDNGVSVNGFEWGGTNGANTYVSPAVSGFDYHNGRIDAFLNSGAMLAADLESGDVAYLCKTNTLEIIK